MNQEKEIQFQPPRQFTGLKLGNPATEAAGFKAVINSFKHVFGAMPVTRGFKALLKLNQQHGIDCPSCAWPDPENRSKVAEFCENGAKAIAEEATTRKTGPVFFQRYSVAELSEKSDYWLGQQGRLTHPMILKNGGTHYEKISWDEAFQHISMELKGLTDPNEAIFYTSGRTSNEAAFLYQLFVRQFGTNNLPDCSNMCHESSGSALTETLGLGKGSVTLEDFNKAEVIMILGQNPGTNHPRMLTALEHAKRNGARIISVNPLIEAGLLAFKNPQDFKDVALGATSLTDIYLQIKINQDLPLLKCLIKIVLEESSKNNYKCIDNEFINNKTEGYSEFIESLNEYSIDELLDQTGLKYEQIAEAAELLIKHDRIIVCWAMGLTQHKNSVATIKEVVNLLLLKGSIGKEGAGTCPVRGHSNVQGDRTMGIYEKPNEDFLKNLDKTFDFKAPRAHGYDTVNAIKAMYSQKAKVFIGMGGNFLSASPDTEFTAKALRNCDLTVHISTKLNRSHLVHGKMAIILPTLGRTDLDLQKNNAQFITVEDSMGVVHISKGILTPPSETLLSEPGIICELAKATLSGKSKVDWEHLASDYDEIRNMIEKVIPGFEHYNEKVRQENGFFLPNLPREGKFGTKSGKALFSINELSPINLAKDEFLMMTVRSHDQFNTTIYGLDDRYRGFYNERRIIMMNNEDIRSLGLQPYQIVDLQNDFGGVKRTAEYFIVVPYNIPRQCTATYFPEANVLVPIDSVALTSNTPTSKSVIITIKPVLEAENIIFASVSH